MLEILT